MRKVGFGVLKELFVDLSRWFRAAPTVRLESAGLYLDVLMYISRFLNEILLVLLDSNTHTMVPLEI